MKSKLVLLGAALILGGYVLAPMALGQGVGYLRANIDPGRAGVFVDGKYLGPAANFGIARKYALSPGEHELKLVDPRFEEFTSKIQIREGKETALWEELKPLPEPQPPFGTLRVICPDKFAAVYLNGKFYGHADEFSNEYQGLLLNPGEYEVRLVPTEGGTLLAWAKVRINEGTTTTVWTKDAEK
jgi:hypothetical protein